MPRTITYYYPYGRNPSALKVFQDKSSQIRGFSFSRDYIRQVAKEEYSLNYAVYFLFNDEIDSLGQKPIYIGQSKHGADRIINHNRQKDFWTHCIMFVSDNNVFDANAIDYMEYYLINLLKNSGLYKLENIEQRNLEPNLNFFDKITYQTYLEQIKFLLKAEGVNFDNPPKITEANSKSTFNAKDCNLFEMLNDETEDEFANIDLAIEELAEDIQVDIKSNKKFYTSDKIYSPSRAKFSEAKLEVINNEFILKKGSKVFKPKDKMIEWTDKGEAYLYHTSIYEKFVLNGMVQDNGEHGVLIEDIMFNSPSSAGSLVIGGPVNGWIFFKELNELRN